MPSTQFVVEVLRACQTFRHIYYVLIALSARANVFIADVLFFNIFGITKSQSSV